MAGDEELGGGGGGEQPSLPPIPVPGYSYNYYTNVAAGGYTPTTYTVSYPWLTTTVAAPQPLPWSPYYQASPGWLCPGCGQGYSPMVAACWHCVPQAPATEEESGEVPPAED